MIFAYKLIFGLIDINPSEFFTVRVDDARHEEDIDINFTCLVVNLPPDIISSVTELCVLGILFQQEKLISSLSTVLKQA